MSAPVRQIRDSPSAFERRARTHGGEGERLARHWTTEVLNRAPLDEIERLPAAGFRSELPGLLARLLQAAEGTAALAPWQAAGIASLVGHRGREEPSLGEVARELAALETVLAASLYATVGRHEPFPLVLGRLHLAFADVQAAAAEESLRRRSRALERLASTDPLTGLRNRRHLDEELERLAELTERYGDPFGVLVFDVVGLKAINDSLGHAAGDRVLVDVGRAAEETVRAVDTVVRVSGDEFCVLAPHQTAEATGHLALRLCSAVAELDGPAGRGAAVTAGVCACPEHGVRGEELLARADAAMYAARAAGQSYTVA